MKLNIGCGNKPLEGYVNLDHQKLLGVDVVHHLNQFPYPFNDNTFSVVEANHVLEHTDNPLQVLEELYRILQVGGVVNVTVPYYSSTGAFQDPTHQTFWAEDTVHQYIVQSVYKKRFVYKLVSLELVYNRPFKHLPFKQIFKKLFFNVVHEMKFVLIKNERVHTL